MKKDLMYVNFKDKKYKVFPKEAVILFICLLLLLIISLVIIDKSMPQYAYWKKENEKISYNMKIKRKEFISQKDYPLLSYNFKDISIGDKKKILVIGDSYLEGDGCFNINQTWWRQLNYELNERGYYDVEVVGVGLCGASTFDELNWLRYTDMIEEIDPDIIIIGYVANDPSIKTGDTNIIKHIEKKDYFDDNKLELEFSKLFPNISYKLNDMLNIKYEETHTFSDYTGYPMEQWYRTLCNDYWKNVYSKVCVGPLSQYISNLDIPTFVVTTPSSISQKYEELYEILDVFEENNMKIYNIYPSFRERFKGIEEYKKYKRINLTNSHPGTITTSFYASYISDILEDEYKEILGNKYDKKIEYPININDCMPYDMSLKLISETNEYTEYEFCYPKNSDETLYMPIQKDYIKLSLQYPINISKIEINGENIKSSELYFTYRNTKLNFDDTDLVKKGKRNGEKCVWNFDDESLVTSINISAKMKNNNENKIVIKIYN